MALPLGDNHPISLTKKGGFSRQLFTPPACFPRPFVFMTIKSEAMTLDNSSARGFSFLADYAFRLVRHQWQALF
jgi:hypothetical protein